MQTGHVKHVKKCPWSWNVPEIWMFDDLLRNHALVTHQHCNMEVENDPRLLSQESSTSILSQSVIPF